MSKKMSPGNQEEIDRLKEERKRINAQIIKLESRVFGYARVSTRGQKRDGNSLEAQEKQLRAAGAQEVLREAYTGATVRRPVLDKLRRELHEGDILIVTKLDRIARSAVQGCKLLEELIEKGVTLRILNMGQFDNTPQGKLNITIMFAFAEFERSMIVERTGEGKAIARKKPGFHEGRPPKYSKEQQKLALDLLREYSYGQVEKMTKISRSTLYRLALKNGQRKTDAF